MTRFRKVKAGCYYQYDPVMLDIINPPFGNIKTGDIVQVVNLPGCPVANTMGHCHVKLNGNFAGLICVNSLKNLPKGRK